MSRSHLGSLLAGAAELSALANRSTYLLAAQAWVRRMLPGDDVFWMDSDFAAGSARVWHGENWVEDTALGMKIATAVDHPVIASYVRNPSDRSPRRISHVTSQQSWRASQAFDLLERTVGRFQLSMVATLEPPLRGGAWVVGRDGRDFSAHEVDVAVSLLPLLAAFDTFYAHRPASAPPRQATDEAAERFGLTAREVEILGLVASGFTADAIARCRGIRTSTVRKHLQNAYGKLGVSDRLLAVDRARRVGILPTVSTD